jgi:hypothetical protein
VIPELDPVSGDLPAGEHRADWHELSARFGQWAWRRLLLEGLLDALRHTVPRFLFQRDRDEGAKGIIVIGLEDLP